MGGRHGFRLRGLEPGDVEALGCIEARATAMLVATGVHPQGPPLSPSEFARFVGAHETIVAEADGELLGYACGRDLGTCYWLAELAVDPDHVRRGIGRALVHAVGVRAEGRSHPIVGLTTYRDVPFNAPFYEGCGFLTVSRQDHDATLEERFLAELPAGVSPEARTVMVRRLRREAAPAIEGAFRRLT